jgi:hypothetical protein
MIKSTAAVLAGMGIFFITVNYFLLSAYTMLQFIA